MGAKRFFLIGEEACQLLQEEILKLHQNFAKIEIRSNLDGVDFVVGGAGVVYITEAQSTYVMSELEPRIAACTKYPLALVLIDRSSFNADYFLRIQLYAAIQGAKVFPANGPVVAARIISKLFIRPAAKTVLSQEPAINFDEQMVKCVSEVEGLSRVSATQVLTECKSFRNLASGEKISGIENANKAKKVKGFLDCIIREP
jgi:hypothetical protein